MGAGLLLTSRVHALWPGFLTYGIGVGVGAGLYITPLFAVVGALVRALPRALALGVASAGSGLGTLLVVPTASRLIDAHGWRTTYVVLGAVDRVVLLVALSARDRAATGRRPRPGAAAASVGSRTVPFRLLFVSAC